METKAFYIMLLVSGAITAYITNHIAPVGIFGFLVIFPIFFSIGRKLYPRTEKDDLKRGLLFPAWFQKGLHYECRDCSAIGYTRKTIGNKKFGYIIDVFSSIIAFYLMQQGNGWYAILVLLLTASIYHSYSNEYFICPKCDSKNIRAKE